MYHVKLPGVIFCAVLMAVSACSSSSSSSGPAKENASANPNTSKVGTGKSSAIGADKANAKLFFDEQVKKAFRNASSPRCLDCHNAPRNVLNNPNKSDEAIYDYTKMFELLQVGGFAVDNGVINPMLGNSSHPGMRICSSPEDKLCALVVEWWNLEFGDSANAAVKYGEISTVSFAGSVSGYALDASNSSQKLKVKVFLDGDSKSGSLVGEQVANLSAKVNGLLQPYGFRVNVPAASIKNDEQHAIHVYAEVNGGLVELAGSPFMTKLYAPKGQGVVGAAYPAAAQTCGGTCHAWNYQTLYGALSNPDPLSGGSATNNRLYNKASGKEPHDGPNVNLNANNLMTWWNCEFRNICN